MNIEQRKKLERLKGEAKAKIEAKVTSVPPADHKSIFGATYLGSKPTDWIKAEGVGWYHVSEQYAFDVSYLKSVAGKWIKKQDAVQILDSEYVISRAELATSKDYFVCAHSQRAEIVANKASVFNRAGKPMFVSTRYAQNKRYFDHCDVLNIQISTDGMIYPRRPKTYARISHYAYTVKCKELFTHCPQCEQVREVIDIVQYPGGGIYCGECYQKNVLQNLIRKYDDKHYPKPVSTKPTVRRLVDGRIRQVPDDEMRYYGVEVEMEIRDGSKFDRWQLAVNALAALGNDFVVFKDDGSLRNHPKDSPLHGFEMVTAPADLATHRERWPKFEAMEGHSQLRAWDTITCGLHVHVDKSGLTTLQIGRLLVFINHAKNKKFVEHIAGRSGGGKNGYNRYIDKRYGDGMRPDPDKYTAINIKPPHTLEFRIFRGTVRARHIIRNIEFCDAVCNFCHPASRSLHEMEDYQHFLNYVAGSRKRYPMLAEWLVAHEYIPALRLKPGTDRPEVVEAEIVEHGVQERR